MYEVIGVERFKDHLIKLRKNKNIEIFFDIETFQYNEEKGRIKPSLYKNRVYSMAISYFLYDKLYVVLFRNFKEFFDSIIETYSKYKKTPRFELIAHNNNKYDNHYLRNDLIYYYDLPYRNIFLLNASEHGNLLTSKLKDLKISDIEQGIILEKRVKSKNNLELDFYLRGIRFTTTDNFLKTHSSLKSLGVRLLKAKKITENELKGEDFNYTKFNIDNNMTDRQSVNYAKIIYKNLTDDEISYIVNDVVILAYSMRYYSLIFKGFDYSKITFTSNILESYNTSNLTSYQLLKSVGQGKNKVGINYTDYQYGGENLYDYLKTFYNGGLNFYNDKFIGKIITEKVFGMDINSSYPFSMHSQKIPTYFKFSQEFDNPTLIPINELEEMEDTYILYRMTKKDFDNEVINKIGSRVLRQMLVKYYSKTEYININSYTIKMIKDICNVDIKELSILSMIGFECVYFGSRDKLEEYYRIKTQGKTKVKLNMDSLYNIYETEGTVDTIYTDEEIDISKLNLNGLYGIPALRPYFNLFRWHNEELKNIENGFLNNQRNVVFSIFVTSVSLYNLLLPLSYLTDKEIDNNFLYCDTDSLYIKKKVADKKIPRSMFNPNNLGAWDIQNNSIDKFYVLNHKKYCYLEDGKIEVKSGGVDKEVFNLKMGFEDFVARQFSHGAILENKKSIFNNQGNISIYKSITELEQGVAYPEKSNDLLYLMKKQVIFNKVREELEGFEDEGLYIESTIGTFSISDLYIQKHSHENKRDISFLMLKEKNIRNSLI